jgi:acylphosphatase
MAKKRLELTYTGNFAGIDFRDQAERFASARKLTGHVSKEAVDRMRIVAEGEEEELKNFLHDLNEYMDIFIEHYTKRWVPASGAYSKFRILKV